MACSPRSSSRRRAPTLMADAQRVEIGFEGGQVVSVRLAEEALRDLRSQLGGGGGWHDLDTEDGVAGARSRPRSPSCGSTPASTRSASSSVSELSAGALLAAAAAGGRGRGAVVAQEPLRLPLRPALLGRGAAPDHHPRASARGARAAAGTSGCSRSAREPAITPLDLAEWVGPARRSRDLRHPAGDARPHDCAGQPSTGSGQRRADPGRREPRCPMRTTALTPSC